MLDVNLFVSFLKGIPEELAVVIIGMTPVFELRGAIPVAILTYKMSIVESFFWSVFGNIIPAIFLILFLDKLAQFLSDKSKFFQKFFDWLFDRTRKKAHDKIEKYGYFGLFLLVAIPLPMTGAWTGAMAVFLFGLERKKAIPVIIAGICSAGVIVSLIFKFFGSV